MSLEQFLAQSQEYQRELKKVQHPINVAGGILIISILLGILLPTQFSAETVLPFMVVIILVVLIDAIVGLTYTIKKNKLKDTLGARLYREYLAKFH